MLRTATLVTLVAAAGVFATQANAHDADFYDGPVYARPFNGNPNPMFMSRPAHETHCERDRRERMEAEFDRMREEQMAAAQAQKAAAAAAAAKQRARLIAQQRQQAAQVAAAKAAAAQAAARERAAATQKAAVAVASKKEDLKPVAAVLKTAVASSEVCHKYSVAADGMIDVPCN